MTYYRNGDPTWTPNDPRFRDDIPRSTAANRGSKSAAAKAERYQRFVRLREEDLLSVGEAARALGIGSTTARQYEAERKLAREEQS